MPYLDANGNNLAPPDPIHVVVADGDYKVKEIIVARQIRASSQQIEELRGKSNLMRESIIILQK